VKLQLNLLETTTTKLKTFLDNIKKEVNAEEK
jgi:hypothetical protein